VRVHGGGELSRRAARPFSKQQHPHKKTILHHQQILTYTHTSHTTSTTSTTKCVPRFRRAPPPPPTSSARQAQSARPTRSKMTWRRGTNKYVPQSLFLPKIPKAARLIHTTASSHLDMHPLSPQCGRSSPRARPPHRTAKGPEVRGGDRRARRGAQQVPLRRAVGGGCGGEGGELV